MVRKKTKLSKEEAIEKLWEMGELTWLLTDVQKDMKKNIMNDSTRTSVVVCSRRLGKTFMLVTLALEQCLKAPNSIVKFLLPKQKDAKTIIQPLMREITETCPQRLVPDYSTQDKIFKFYNGSEIHLGGSDLSAESLRGTRAELVLIDEAGFVNDLSYTITSILSPTIRTTRGRMILASTPSRDPQHEFVQKFMNPYRASGRCKIYDIYQNPNFTPEIIKEIIQEYPRGKDDPDFRREYMCEVFVDEETTICPEFSSNKDVVVFNDETAPELPEHRDFYVGMDIGHKDLTLAIFTYYDFKESCLVIMDELVMNGPTMTTKKLADEITVKEKIRFYDPRTKEQHKAYLRVMDINLGMQQDLNHLHGISFISTKKDNKEGQINEMRMWVGTGKVKIHERCSHLIYHLEYGQWNDKRTDFKRLPDTPDKLIKGGHVDGIPALYYLIRNIQRSKNPFPFGFGLNINKNTFMSPKFSNKKTTQAADFISKVLQLKKKK